MSSDSSASTAPRAGRTRAVDDDLVAAAHAEQVAADDLGGQRPRRSAPSRTTVHRLAGEQLQPVERAAAPAAPGTPTRAALMMPSPTLTRASL